MKHFLYLHLRDSSGQAGHLLGNTLGNSALGLSQAAQEASGRRALWRLNDDGTLELGGSFGQVLDIDSGGRLHLRPAEAGASRWTIDNHGRLKHAVSGKSVVRAANGGSHLQLRDTSGDSDTPAQLYVDSLAQAVDTILALPKQGYTQFQGSQALAYQWIIAQLPMLMGGDLRLDYTRIDFEPDMILGRLNRLTYPAGAVFSQNDFNTVINSLLTELETASAVITNMTQTVQFWQQVFSDDSGYLNSLQTDLTEAAQSTPSVSLVLATLFENILYTAFSVFGVEGGFIANVMATAFNTAVAYISTHGQEPLSFAQLQDNLRTGLDTILTQLVLQKDTILSNGNMAQSFAAFVHQHAPTNTGLNNAKLTAEYVYLQQVLQNVLPGMCTLVGKYFVSKDDAPPSSVPTYNALAYHNNEGRFLFWVQMKNGSALPKIVSDLMCNGAWMQAAGANPEAFFLGLEGWVWTKAQTHNNQYGPDDLIISIANTTGVKLKVKAKPKDGDIQSPKPDSGKDDVSIEVDPGDLGIIIASYKNGLATNITIKAADGDAGSGDDPLASFHCHQHQAGLGGAPWVEKLEVAPGYQLPQPVCVSRIRAIQKQPGMMFAALASTQ